MVKRPSCLLFSWSKLLCSIWASMSFQSVERTLHLEAAKSKCNLLSSKSHKVINHPIQMVSSTNLWLWIILPPSLTRTCTRSWFVWKKRATLRSLSQFSSFSDPLLTIGFQKWRKSSAWDITSLSIVLVKAFYRSWNDTWLTISHLPNAVKYINRTEQGMWSANDSMTL